MKYLKKLFGKYGTVIPATGEMIYDVGCTMYDLRCTIYDVRFWYSKV